VEKILDFLGVIVTLEHLDFIEFEERWFVLL